MAMRRAMRLEAFLLIVVVSASIPLWPGLAQAGPTHSCFGKPATIVGTSGRDRIIGTNGNDIIVAFGGADYVDGKAGDDRICLGRGGHLGSGNRTEWAEGGPGNDKIDGGRGDDLIVAGPGRDLVLGGQGKDEIFGDQGADKLKGGRGADYINGGDQDDVIKGGPGSDYLSGDAGDDAISGGGSGPGGDTVSYASNRDDDAGGTGEAIKPVRVNLKKNIAKGPGRDTIKGVENIFGSRFDDVLKGDGGSNTILGGAGSDRIDGRGGDDCLDPNIGNDVVHGGTGFDFYTANVNLCAPNPFSSGISPGSGVTVDLSEGYASNDLEEDETRSTLVSIEGIYGSSQQDTLIGDDGPNHIFGNGGPDHIEGMGGDDLLDGGSGGGDFADGGEGIDECQAEATINCESGDLMLDLSTPAQAPSLKATTPNPIGGWDPVKIFDGLVSRLDRDASRLAALEASVPSGSGSTFARLFLS